MVPKHQKVLTAQRNGFRAVLFRMVPKLLNVLTLSMTCFRAVLFRMVPKPKGETGERGPQF